MTFNEVLQTVKATPGLSFTGLALRPDGRYLGIFTVSSSDELEDDDYDPEWVSIHFDGGLLFSSDGEEEFYSLDDAPDIVQSLIYQPSTLLPDTCWVCSEYVLHRVFPQLPDPDRIWTANERLAFVAQAMAVASESGFVTITDQV
ncbi:hypothetical protein D3C78_887760 [compost metagenome]